MSRTSPLRKVAVPISRASGQVESPAPAAHTSAVAAGAKSRSKKGRRTRLLRGSGLRARVGRVERGDYSSESSRFPPKRGSLDARPGGAMRAVRPHRTSFDAQSSGYGGMLVPPSSDSFRRCRSSRTWPAGSAPARLANQAPRRPPGGSYLKTHPHPGGPRRGSARSAPSRPRSRSIGKRRAAWQVALSHDRAIQPRIRQPRTTESSGLSASRIQRAALSADRR